MKDAFKDGLAAGAVYVTAYMIGRLMVDHFGFDPYLTGWIFAALAVLFRWHVWLVNRS